MNTNKKINLDSSKLYGFKIANHSLSQQNLPVVLSPKIGLGPAPDFDDVSMKIGSDAQY